MMEIKEETNQEPLPSKRGHNMGLIIFGIACVVIGTLAVLGKIPNQFYYDLRWFIISFGVISIIIGSVIL